ncbi:MAG: ATP-binding protein, partial [Planctomycetota bacterium]
EGTFTFIIKNKEQTINLGITAIKFMSNDSDEPSGPRREPLLLVMAQDITELKRMERLLKEINLHLEEKVKEKSAALLEAQKRLLETERLATLGQLSAGLVHEINNPLCGISNYLELITSGRITEEQQKYLSCVSQGVEIIKSITGNLLDLARVNNLELTEVDIHELIKEVVVFLKPRLDREQVKIKTIFSNDKFPLIRVDKNKIKQVFLNIIINALEAISGEGRIELKTVSTGRELMISISDNGIGIPADKLPHIFKPFVSGAKKKGKRGTGLGLFMAANIISAHQGDIKVETKPGAGTKFVITLPVGELRDVT